MKASLIALVFAAMPAFGSHFIRCKVDVEVTGVQNLARLDGAAVFSNSSMVKADHEQTVSLKVLDVKDVEGRGGCFSKGSDVTLAVKDNQVGLYKKGDLLTLQYQNVGDRPGSRISWDIIK